MSYSKALGLSYQYFPNLDQLIFEDGVCYTTEEAVLMAKMDGEAIRAVHAVKSVFGGQVLRESEGKKQEEQDKCWFELVPPVPDEEIPVLAAVPKKKTPSPFGDERQPDAEILTFDL